jgi:hypothetical protein
MTTPNIIFIVPYRDREQQYQFFSKHMKTVLSKVESYEIFYIHQNDTRSFNRGAMKNIGFLMVKNRYPESYFNITLVFNDIDIMPFTPGFLDYSTTQGTVKHFYGYKHTLGGIVSIQACDFEAINGFPNFWAWGYEDNELQHRVKNYGLHLDRSQFYPMWDKNILMLTDGTTRIVNKGEFDAYISKSREGIDSIRELQYTIDESTGYVNVTDFKTNREENKSLNTIHDLKKGNVVFKGKQRRGMMTMNLT